MNKSKSSLFGAALMIFGLSLTAAWQTSTQRVLADKLPHEAAKQPVIKERVLENYGKLPLAFEPNQGQADKAVKYLSRGSGYTLYLTGNEAVMSLRNPDAGKNKAAFSSGFPAAQFQHRRRA